MGKRILRIVFVLILVALTVGIVVYYFYDINVNGSGWTENLFRTFTIAFSGVIGLVRLFVGGAGRKSLGFYESQYSEQINNAFSDNKRNRKKLLKAIRFYNENKLKKAANYLIDLKKECNTTDEYRAVGLLLGLTFTDMEFYLEAINVYEQIVYMGLATDTMYSNLGHIYAKLGNSEQAMKHYEKALYINPKNAYAYNNIAKIHFDKHSFDEAIKYAKKALEINSKVYQASTLLAIVYSLEGNKQEADKYYHMAISSGQNPKDLKNAIDFYKLNYR